MKHQQSNGHADALAEPNSASSVPSPFIKKPKKTSPEKEEKNDAVTEEYFAVTEQDEMSTAMMQEEMEMSADGTAATLPIPPIPIIKNKVFGRYRGQLGNFELELRVDIDGATPLQKVSGDYYMISGQTKSYFGSFIADSITTTIVNGIITITGNTATTWGTSYTKLKIAIKQTLVFQPLAPAMLQWFHVSTGAPGAMYVCNNFSRAFRTVRLEQDRTSGVVPFVNYNTGLLPSGGPARVLSINAAYGEAGVEMNTAGISNVVPMALAGADAKWTNAELHNAMVNHFSLYQNNPAWDVWLLHAYEHINGPGLYGIMFDQTGLQRQGAAVFYRGIGGASAEQQRLQLYTCVHELGHCFNLLHSWQKSLATPPKPNIPSSLSWMNYPWGYPGGAVAFWSHFAFRFDPTELTHIRHGFRNNVIMGGNPFTVGSSLQDIGSLFEDNIDNTTNLELQLEAKKTYMLGEPVVLETKLKTTSTKNNRVNSSLHVNYGFVTIGIKKPGGETLVYEPLAEMCIEPEHTVLNSSNPGVYESSYIGFGKQGFIFDQAGNYQVRAVYYHEDGSRIVSDTLTLRVKYPSGKHDDEVADLLLTDEVGYLFAFMGSDAPYLKKGNDAINTVVDKYKDHPLAVYAQFIKGVNEQRTFKTITADKTMEVRMPDFNAGEVLLNEVIEKSKQGKGLDNISLNQSMQILAKAYQREGNMKAAESTVKNLVAHFNKQPIKQEVKEMIAKDAAQILAPEKEDRKRDTGFDNP
ncbi:hypothetical protein [Ferruginibacter sp. SUN106]|uniref:hypothetical protein n=1 Tax=Ferruginibacter sp. SUN106 TaxID=2978348 RepID=UPI003D36D6BD